MKKGFSVAFTGLTLFPSVCVCMCMAPDMYHLQELTERMRRLQGERENLQSKLEAEKHVMRAQLRDLMQKHESELRRITEKHEQEMSEKEQALHGQLKEPQRTPVPPAPVMVTDAPSNERLSEMEGSLWLCDHVTLFIRFCVI